MGTQTETLLVELLTEELPPKALQTLGGAFAHAIHAGLLACGLADAEAKVEMFATPRRLAVRIGNVRGIAPDRAESKKLMPSKVALDANGAPTPALQKRLEKEGAAFTQTSRKVEGGEEIVYLALLINGMSLAEGLQAALHDAITKLPIPKLMSYQLADGLTTVQFVRPAHGLVAMHGADVVAVHALGLQAGNVTHGHRFQGEKTIVLSHAGDYESQLEKAGGVIASFDKRRHEIERLLFRHAEQCGDTLGEREDYAALLDEVTGLVEMPTVYVGQFEREFLEVPAECLILTMKLNQKYFPLFLSEGGLSSRFLLVSNMRLDDPRTVIEGNQRVIRPRLADARFFFETDKKIKLVNRLPKLADVVYHNKLGSQLDRVGRVKEIAQLVLKLSPYLTTGDSTIHANIDNAASLLKADLLTDMVGEFPELQGIMGRRYAQEEGWPDEVAFAIEDHYKPKSSGDSLPREGVGVVVALADKLETLVGLFGVGQRPSGDKDPYALRRHALGVVRLLVEKQLAPNLNDLLKGTVLIFGDLIEDKSDDVSEFVFDRFSSYLKDLGYLANEIDAVLSLKPQRLYEVSKHLEAVRAFSALPEAQSLAAANKRIGNILKKSDAVDAAYSKQHFVELAEMVLANVMEQVIPLARAEFDNRDYTASLKCLAALREPVDTFFDQVMVNADDPLVRANRLGLLATLHREMNRVADLSKLAS